MKNEIYFDNASTSYPKLNLIPEVLSRYMREGGCSPGRSGYRKARKSEEMVDQARQSVATLLGCSEYRNISYTYNATYALNMVIKGYLKQGDHVITTCLEHNSVLRPLEQLQRAGTISYSVVGLNDDGLLDMDEFRQSFQTNTTLVVTTHASNVLGTVTPIEEIISYAHNKEVKVLVDLAQSAGFLDISLEKWGVDFAAFTGHKSLLGLPGIGGLYTRDTDELDTIIEGGTGVNSISLMQPGYSPEKFEAGTCNYTGIAILGATSEYLRDIGLNTIQEHERHLLDYLTGALRSNAKVTLYGDTDIANKVPVLSFNAEGIAANEVSTMLDDKYGIMTRPGLQCAPLVHKAIGTSPNGTVRVSFGYKNTIKECHSFITAIDEITSL